MWRLSKRHKPPPIETGAHILPLANSGGTGQDYAQAPRSSSPGWFAQDVQPPGEVSDLTL
jgi:hypothetical protein